ncbi:biopolymer transport protein ExbD [Rhodovulum sulfidophilum]|uniref:ExbD/TolR family protein n=1 Tax=Rhodovulum sulfidophilum TaxID=35806 RepID=UPI0005A6CD53|nr:biopolymer transporter ExbD [Rhodovulum sulfidophilum]ANB33973.1 biopolymer transporter ExbD [Rhodovulum sulfidophilum DSM 1374]ANB37795.1 biopolymer transporter ExbD [Rhodovulum sulfidophilum]MCW2304243.1 biopolymer transport protein ExbD [Rhodovulum sulfidophilum]
MTARKAAIRAEKVRRAGREPTIALINIVFLLLIFFLVAGTLAAPLDATLKLVDTEGLEGASPAEALVLHADGRMTLQEQETTPEAFVAGLEGTEEEAATVARVVPDRDVPAADLVALGQALRAAGAERVVIVTERGLK